MMSARASEPGLETLMSRARSLYDYGRWSDARHEFLRAREVAGASDRRTSQEIDYYLAACAVELGSTDAVGALLDFESRYPESVYVNDVRFSLGSYYCAAGDMKRAREAFERTEYKALDAPRRERYDIRMGYVEFTDGQYAAAYECFDRIPSRSEYVDHARYYKAYIDYAEGRYGRAKQAFTALSHSDAYRDVVPYYLLQIEFHEGNYRYVVDNGEALVSKAVPARRAELERVIAESWFRLEDYNRTLEHLEAFRQNGGEMDRDANYLMGFSLYRTARYTAAAEWLRKACGAEDALTQNASYHLADCYLRLDDKESAMQAFAMASDDSLDAEIAEDALFNYAKLQYELGGGAFNGAINMLTRYLERYPSSPRASEARTLLIAAYYNSRDYDAAYRAIKSMPSGDAEIRAALQTALSLHPKRLIAVFQPHTYTRTAALADKFIYSFCDADAVFVFKEFAARETGGGMTAFELYNEMRNVREGCFYYGDLLSLGDGLKKFVAPGDVVMLIGAGDVKRLAEIL